MPLHTQKDVWRLRHDPTYAPNCRTLKESRKDYCRVLGSLRLITSQHSIHTHHDALRSPPIFRFWVSRGPIFRGPFSRAPIFRGPFFRGPFFPGTIFLGGHFSGDIFSQGPFFRGPFFWDSCWYSTASAVRNLSYIKRYNTCIKYIGRILASGWS